MKLVNKQALFGYEVLEKLEAGIVLTGAEAKSIRDGRIQMGQSYVRLKDGEAWLVGAHIPRYQFSGDDVEEERDRKLLLNRHEIARWLQKVQTKGITIVPLSVYTHKNLIKMELALAKGRTEFDKRAVKKKQDVQRDVEREVRGKVRVK